MLSKPPPLWFQLRITFHSSIHFSKTAGSEYNSVVPASFSIGYRCTDAINGSIVLKYPPFFQPWREGYISKKYKGYSGGETDVCHVASGRLFDNCHGPFECHCSVWDRICGDNKMPLPDIAFCWITKCNLSDRIHCGTCPKTPKAQSYLNKSPVLTLDLLFFLAGVLP